ncbi:hypothetical protein HYV64_04940 [Candidatus Shapirobacteria bacterium]|nr:hypothetical protein [Candidatus Shapirobacteria bacterium]
MTNSKPVKEHIFFPDKLKGEGKLDGREEIVLVFEKICNQLDEASLNPSKPDLSKLVETCNTNVHARGAALSIRDHLHSVLEELDLVKGPEAREVEQKYAFALGAIYIATSQPYRKSIL